MEKIFAVIVAGIVENVATGPHEAFFQRPGAFVLDVTLRVPRPSPGQRYSVIYDDFYNADKEAV